MRSARAIPATLLLLALLASDASATWKAFGTAEPDSTYDSSDFMWYEPPAPGERKVYFNAFQTLGYVLVNPNVGALGTRILAEPHQGDRAMLGVWQDCNGDGYVGMAETALQDYRAELLPADGQARCPPRLGEPTHNDGVWVTELIPIGPDYDGKGRTWNPRVYYDDFAQVWGDRGRPVPRVPDDAAPVYVSDCAQAATPQAPMPALDPTNPSVPEAPSLDELSRSPRAPDACSPENTQRRAQLLLMNDERRLEGYKTEADFPMHFERGARGREGRAMLGRAAPQDFGVTALGSGDPRAAGTTGMGLWVAPGGALTLSTNSVVDEELTPQDAEFLTFYARLGQAGRLAGTLPTASVGVYGSAFCPAFGQGAGRHHGWDCDGNHWYGGADEPTTDVVPLSRARPGDTYQLRDVDCYDGSLSRDLPLGVGIRWLSDVPCFASPQPPVD